MSEPIKPNLTARKKKLELKFANKTTDQAPAQKLAQGADLPPPQEPAKNFVSVSPDAKSKNLESTLGKLSATKKEHGEVAMSSSLKIRAKKLPELSAKPAAPETNASNTNLKGLRIMSPAPSAAQHSLSTTQAVIKPAQRRVAINAKAEKGDSALALVGTVLTALWCGVAGYYIQGTIGLGTLLTQQPHILGGFLAGILAPLAFLWLIINSFSKGKATIIEKRSSGKMDSKAEATLSKMGNMMESQSRRFSAIMSEIENKAKSLSLSDSVIAPFKSSTSVTAIDQILNKAGDLENRLEQKISNLNNVLDNVDNKMGVNIKRMIEGLNRAAEDAVKQTDTVMQGAENKVKDLQKTGKDTADTIRVVLEQIDASTGKMGNSAELIESRLTKISSAVTDQADQIDKAQEKMHERLESIEGMVSEPIKKIEAAVNNADTKHGEIADMLDKRVTDLNNASDKAVEKAKVIREDMRSQAQEISTLVGQISGHSKSVQSMMRSQKEDLDANVGSALDKIEQVSDSLHGESKKLNDMVSRTEESMSALKVNVSEHCDEATDRADQVTEKLKSLDDVLEGRVKMLLDKSMEANDAVKDVTNTLVSSTDIIEPIYSKATEQIERTRSRFEKMAVSFEQGTENNLNKLKDIGVEFDERLDNLSTGAEKAAQVLDRSSDNLSVRVDDIDSAAKSAQSRLGDMEQLFKKQSSEITLATDQAMMRIETVQQALDGQFHDLSASVAESAAQIANAGTLFARESEAMAQSSDKALSQYDKLGEKTQVETANLQKLAQATMSQISDVVGRVKQETINLLDTSDTTLMELKKSSDDFAERSKSIETQMKSSLDKTRDYSHEMGDEAINISEISQKAEDRITDAISQLAKKMLEVDDTAARAQSHIEKSREKLEVETDYLADVSIKAAKVVDEAAASYIRQSHSLAKATEQAEIRAKQMREAETRVERDKFMNSAKFILESLHSLSVDMTRSFHGKIAEKTWKAYQKGDIAAFTKALLAQKSKLPVDKIADKYKNDNEFRTYVNRFTRQFEEVYEQAGESDKSELLKTTFASSDVAQLYTLLCDAIEHDSVLGKWAA